MSEGKKVAPKEREAITEHWGVGLIFSPELAQTALYNYMDMLLELNPSI